MQRGIQTQKINIRGSNINISNILTNVNKIKMLFVKIQSFIHLDSTSKFQYNVYHIFVIYTIDLMNLYMGNVLSIL